jgi:hypothetical protein
MPVRLNCECPFLAEDYQSLQCYGCPLWARSRPWLTESERLLSPKATLKIASREAAFDTQETPTNSQINTVSPVQYDDSLRRQIDSFDIKRLANLVQGLINA